MARNPLRRDPRDTCSCSVCHSDLAFIVPCLKTWGPTEIEVKKETIRVSIRHL